MSMTLDPYASHFDIEMLKMAHAMAIRGGSMGRKAKMLQNHWFLYVFLRVIAATTILGKSSDPPSRTLWEGVGRVETLPLGDKFGGFGRFVEFET